MCLQTAVFCLGFPPPLHPHTYFSGIISVLDLWKVLFWMFLCITLLPRSSTKSFLKAVLPQDWTEYTVHNATKRWLYLPLRDEATWSLQNTYATEYYEDIWSQTFVPFDTWWVFFGGEGSHYIITCFDLWSIFSGKSFSNLLKNWWWNNLVHSLQVTQHLLSKTLFIWKHQASMDTGQEFLEAVPLWAMSQCLPPASPESLPGTNHLPYTSAAFPSSILHPAMIGKCSLNCELWTKFKWVSIHFNMLFIFSYIRLDATLECDWIWGNVTELCF